MSEGFFREEAIKGRRADWLGELRLQAPRFGWSFLGIGVITTLAILAALFFVQYTRHERVSGVLRATRGVLDLRSTKEGVITRILVADGKRVKTGQSLVEISSELASITLGETQEAIHTALVTKSAGLQRELQQQELMLSTSRADLTKRMEAIDTQIESVSKQISIQKSRVAELSEMHERWEAFRGTGVISKVQLLERRGDLFQQKSQVEELARTKLLYMQQKSELQEKLLNAPFEASRKKGELSRALADVSQSLAENEASRGIVLKAQTDGVVTNLSAHPGEQVVASQRILSVVPKDTKLIAELWVPTRAIGFIEVGNPVILRYRAFPYPKFGAYRGEIVDISRSGLSPTEIGKQMEKAEDSGTYYRVLVGLEKQQILAYGRLESLLPGMEVDADVLVERRRLFEWMFEPIYGFVRANEQTDIHLAGRENGG